MATQIPRVSDPQVLPSFPRTGQAVVPARGGTTTNDIEAEQDAIKRGVNDPEIKRLLGSDTGRQTANPPADAPEFQPFEPDYEKREVRWQHGSESDEQYSGIDAKPGTAPGGLPRDPQFSAKTCIVGDMVTGPDPKGRFSLAPANQPGDIVTGTEIPDGGPRRPMIKDFSADEEHVFVQNAPNPGEGSELR